MAVDVLTVSSKGQVVLPASIRKSLSIETGARLAAYATDDFIMLKVLRVPTAEESPGKVRSPAPAFLSAWAYIQAEKIDADAPAWA